RSRMWDGYLGPAGIQPRRDAASLERFNELIRERFDSPNVQIDLFERRRPKYKDNDRTLLQATIYFDGRPDEELEFVDGALDRRFRRRVSETAITYEASSGAIEVVGNDRESRADLARLFVVELLGSKPVNERLPLRRYDLGVLLRPHQFP